MDYLLLTRCHLSSVGAAAWCLLSISHSEVSLLQELAEQREGIEVYGERWYHISVYFLASTIFGRVSNLLR